METSASVVSTASKEDAAAAVTGLEATEKPKLNDALAKVEETLSKKRDCYKNLIASLDSFLFLSESTRFARNHTPQAG